MKKSRAEWEVEVERHASSGVSQTAYAKREGLSLSTFQYWRRKILKETSAEPEFVEVPGGTVLPRPAASERGIELELPHGIVLRVRG